ncbi:hypothetical protein NSK_006296 [Nannochloropsis salina CCMP1776]|uniref:Ribosomal eL28/Mak16 domain-containing protein n=1 Tax=Nannochloropsis salina CCMP1776 TaxID=1027361 RepID=A0A4D9CYB5_9STRA|nr:hypothetical protein NSK_006296 [Nannochloropsis salina CCMP1776]|eukprot:TFJ82385.1 hypothetical protein NSK_006296 [Nannochloropsis salina CCMP1776]
MSDALVWECIKNNNCFLTKRGRTARVGGVQFSSEPFNLAKKNSFKNSGLANSKAVDLSVAEGGKYGPKITMATKGKKSLKKPATLANETPLNKAFATSVRSIKGVTEKSGYRKDLQPIALARYSLLKRYTQVKKGLAKPIPVKMGRVSRKE